MKNKIIEFLIEARAKAKNISDEFVSRRDANHKELIRGSVLDPSNHPSKDR